MPAQARTPRQDWIAAGLNALARGGPEAVRIEPLARELGATKGSFYWHFEGRAALLEALLDDWERSVVDDVIAQVDAGGGDARDRLRRLFALAGTRRDVPPVELAIRDWARRDAAVARRLKRLDNRRFAYMRPLFAAIADDDDDAEVRCTLAFALFVGHPLIAADHPGRTRKTVLDLALAHLLR
jgi:AcrR family transcriptional regulator